MMYTVTSHDLNSYKGACALIKELKEKGIESNITEGGINIYVNSDEEIKTMWEVCGEVNALPYIGETVFVQWSNMSDKERFNKLEKYNN